MTKKFGHLLEDWNTAKEEMRQVLIDRARQRLTITYGELAAATTTISIPHHGYAMSGMLRDLYQDDVAAKRPSLATLVVRKSDGLPGPGYFTGLAEIGIPEGDFKAYWEARFEEICSYWQTHQLD